MLRAVAVVLLMGVLVFPFWLTEAVGAARDPALTPAAKNYWDLAWPVLAAIGVAIGCLGLFRWALAFRLGQGPSASKLRTRLMMGAGIVGWACFVFFDPWGPEADADSRPWTFFYPMALVLGGAVGVVGILGMLVVLARRRPNRGFALSSLGACSVGIASLVLFSVPLMSASLQDILLLPFEAPIAFLIYFLLPAIGTTHILFLARRTLFPDLYPTQAD